MKTFFTSYPLRIHLKNHRFQVTKTIQNALWLTKKTMNKQKRQGHSYSFDTNKEILIVRWLNNSVVNIEKNFDRAELIHEITCGRKN